MNPGLVVAAPASGNGKTTITLGLMGALSARGETVLPFKVGPDYIDPGFHEAVSRNPSYNLDGWMLEPGTVRHLFEKRLRPGGIPIVEGVMGLFDGHLCENERGSTAHVAKILGLPVLLVVDAAKMSASAAALVSGFRSYDPEMSFIGVVLNRVNSEHHYLYLKRKIESATGLTVWGRLPKDENFQLKSRHLGLVPSAEVGDLSNRLDVLVKAMETHIDIPGLLVHLRRRFAQPVLIPPSPPPGVLANAPRFPLRIGIAMDEAFSFYYRDNLQLFEQLGVETVPFSPLNDEKVPKGIHGLYLGGGFPEVFAAQLTENEPMRKDLKRVLSKGLPYFAECGGMMVLCNEIISTQGVSYPMAGWFNASCQMTERLHRFGYVKVTVRNNQLFPGINREIRAHEFHHSKIIENRESLLYQIRKEVITGLKEWQCGLTKKNGVAGYPHFHFYATPDLLLNFLDVCSVNELSQW